MALNYVKGTISHKGDVQQGTSQNGFGWARQVVVIDVASFNGSFTKIALTAQNQRVDELAEYNIGDRVEIGYSVTAREYQGKWFNNVDLVNIKPDGESAPAAPRQVARPAKTTPQIPEGAEVEPKEDDLPF